MKFYNRRDTEQLREFIRANQGSIYQPLTLHLTTIETLEIIKGYINNVGLSEYKEFLRKIADDDIIKVDTDGSYTIKDDNATRKLGVYNLSTAQRVLLYIKSCINMGVKVAFTGALECLDKHHRSILSELMEEDKENLVSILVFNTLLIPENKEVLA